MALPRPLTERPALHVVLIVLLGMLVYSNTMLTPFQWDDKLLYVAENPIVQDLGYFIDPSRAKGLPQYPDLVMRYVGYLTFAINYRLHGLDVRGYHAVNIAIHLLSALVLYAFMRLTLRTPLMSGTFLEQRRGYAALFGALLFVAHPVQTEAVTYVFQRLASLAALFYMLSLTAYAAARLDAGRKRSAALYAVSVLFAVLAMKTKENAVTLPVMAAVYEAVFFAGSKEGSARRALRLIPLALTMAIVPLTLAALRGPDAGLAGYDRIEREEYLFTQMYVVMRYIRLLIIPLNQNISYDIALFKSFFTPLVFMSFYHLMASFLLPCLYVCFSRRFRDPAVKLLGFGALWFFIALSVESSVIPIPILITEYRVYLPSAGAFMAASALAALWYERSPRTVYRTALVAALAAFAIVLSAVAYARNGVWRSEVSLWEDALRKSPRDRLVHDKLAVAYMSEGRISRAIQHLDAMIGLYPDYAEAYNKMGVAYARRGDTDRAIEWFQAALKVDPSGVESYVNLCQAYAMCSCPGPCEHTVSAVENCLRALEELPENRTAHYGLAMAYLKLGRNEDARGHFARAGRAAPY